MKRHQILLEALVWFWMLNSLLYWRYLLPPVANTFKGVFGALAMLILMLIHVLCAYNICKAMQP